MNGDHHSAHDSVNNPELRVASVVGWRGSLGRDAVNETDGDEGAAHYSGDGRTLAEKEGGEADGEGKNETSGNLKARQESRGEYQLRRCRVSLFQVASNLSDHPFRSLETLPEAKVTDLPGSRRRRRP